eukprot:TRINITY_DN5695_c0_g1_i1.p1 TRINITY_DN5695_c0_g1~~TRINITY_DN5695_c0_g1_i1.p1  ORF type:complete len:177 (+),score=37.93 TRINITY_DN5695_c0_g1_i1:77-607(+)
MRIANKHDKTLRIDTSEDDREEIEFFECDNLTVVIDFKFSFTEVWKDGYEKWHAMKDKPKKQSFVFHQCRNIKVKEIHTLEAHYSFVDCQGIDVRLGHCNQSADIVNCSDVLMIAPLLETMSVYKCTNVKLRGNTHFSLFSVGCAAVDVQRKWDVRKMMEEKKGAELNALMAMEGV